jgi:Fibronectin type III domain
VSVVDITSRSVTLQWLPPTSTGGTELTGTAIVPKIKQPQLTKNVFSGYIIEKRISSSKSWEKVITLEPSVTQHCISNLKEKSQYFFRVYAENAIGLSEPSETDAVQLKTHACKFACATIINRYLL